MFQKAKKVSLILMLSIFGLIIFQPAGVAKDGAISYSNPGIPKEPAKAPLSPTTAPKLHRNTAEPMKAPPASERGEAATSYPYPGIVALHEGKWIGSDHLYNLSNQIEIVVEIFKPEALEIPLTKEMLRERIVEIFKNAKIEPFTNAEPGQPPLPFFHMLIMITPIEKGFAVYCQGRLFEKIELKRVKLSEQTTYQAITWESSDLITTPTEKVAAQINSCVDEITGNFINRYQFFANLRNQIQIQ